MVGWLTGVSCLVLIAGFIAWCAYRCAQGVNNEHTDWGHARLNRLDRINRCFCRRIHGMPDTRLDLPVSGGVVLVANHVSGLDPLLLIAFSRRPIRFLIAREQYERAGLSWFFRRLGCIPVDRKARPQKAFYEAKAALAAGEVIGVFPEGGIVTRKKPVVRLKRGAELLANMAEVPIVPVRIGNVRGRGLTLLALLLPGSVTIAAGEVLPYVSGEKHTRQGQIRQFIRPDLEA